MFLRIVRVRSTEQSGIIGAEGLLAIKTPEHYYTGGYIKWNLFLSIRPYIPAAQLPARDGFPKRSGSMTF